MQPINRIVTHVAPHLDEIFAIWLLRHFGEAEFPGVSSAPVEYWEAGMEETNWRDHFAAGTLQLGVGGGRFDEHPRPGRDRKEGHSATSLVATALNVASDEGLKRTLDYVITDDLEGSRNPFSLASLVVTLHRQHPNDPQFVIDWATTAIDALLANQQHFFGETRREFEEKAVITTFRQHGKKRKLAAIETDDLQVPAFARSKLGGYVAVVIMRNSGGQTSILTNKHYRLKLNDLARCVRIEERRTKDESRPSANWKSLEIEGEVSGAEEWFYFKEGEMLLNGSPTHPEVPPTSLTLERLVELVTVALSDREFEPTRQEQCREGVCTNSSASPCPWYHWGLSRCRTIRYRTAYPGTGK